MLTALLGNRRMNNDRDPASGFWYGPVGRKTVAGVNVNAITALTMSAVWCGMRYLCGVMGSLPMNYYRTEDGSRFLLSDDPVQRLIHKRPNPQMRPSTFKSLLTKWQVGHGNGYAEIQWMDWNTKEEPYALWPIHPSRVRPIVNQNDELMFEVKNNGEVKPTYVDMESMVHIPNIVLAEDGMSGLGIFDHARETIGGGLAAEEESNRTFSSGRMPKIVVESPGKPSPESRTNFRKEWREVHTDSKFDVALLAEGMVAKVLSANLRDSQFIELRQFIIEEVARWLGIPPQKLQHLLRTSYNSAEQLNTEVTTDTLIPQAKPWEEELEWKLTPERLRDSRTVRFAFQGLLRGDTNARGNFYRTMSSIGALNRNEIRELEDYNPVPGGDTFLTQGANVSLNDDGEPAPPAASQSPKPTPAPIDDSSDQSSPILAALTKQAEQLEQTRDELKQAARGLVMATMSRMIFIETTAAKRAAKKPLQFSQWVSSFYVDHQAVMSEAMTPVFAACASFGIKTSAASWSVSICDRSRLKLLAIAEQAEPDKLPEVVTALMGEWESSRVAEIVASIAELN